MEILNILVTGPFGAGKTQFIETISDIPVVSTERKLSDPSSAEGKATTTVAMDYGRVTMEDAVLHLRGTPGQDRFDFMWEILSREADGYILLVDAAEPEKLGEAQLVMDTLGHLDKIPKIVVANKQDLPESLDMDKIRTEMGLPDTVLVMPCTSTRKSSVKQVLHQLLEQFNDGR